MGDGGDGDDLVLRARSMLESEFLRGMAEGPFTRVATPHDAHQSEPLVAVVVALVLREEYALAHLVSFVHLRSQAGDREAARIERALARAYATHYAARMAEAGDMEPLA